MKRFFALMSAIVIVLSCMVVPASATFYGDKDLPDISAYMEDYIHAYIWKYDNAYWLFVSDNLEYGTSTGSKHVLASADEGREMKLYRSMSPYSTWVKYSQGKAINQAAYNGSFVWSKYNIYDNETNTVMYVGEFGDAPAPVCDGSTCPATDVNVDGICDNCGMTLMNLVRTPTAPNVEGNNLNTVMFYSGTTYYYTVYSSDDAYTIKGYPYGTRWRTDTSTSVNVRKYESHDGLNWAQTYNDNSSSNYPGEQGYDLISSTFTWYDENDEPFFPVPLWAEVEEVTQGEMMGLGQTMGGTLKVLVPCGVGLMACLVVLGLFGKRLLIFRS